MHHKPADHSVDGLSFIGRSVPLVRGRIVPPQVTLFSKTRDESFLSLAPDMEVTSAVGREDLQKTQIRSTFRFRPSIDPRTVLAP